MGKIGSREIDFQKGSEVYLERVYDLRKRDLGENPPLDGYVFCHKDCRPIGSMKRGFRSLLTYCDLGEDSRGRMKTLYGLRRFMGR